MRRARRPRYFTISGGFRKYLGRRARRILPPYYAAMILSLLLLAVVPPQVRETSHWFDSMQPAFTPGVLVSHLLLVHNLDNSWVYRINAPFWSVATEWQIYFLFPLLLLPVLRKFGMGAAVVCGFVI